MKEKKKKKSSYLDGRREKKGVEFSPTRVVFLARCGEKWLSRFGRKDSLRFGACVWALWGGAGTLYRKWILWARRRTEVQAGFPHNHRLAYGAERHKNWGFLAVLQLQGHRWKCPLYRHSGLQIHCDCYLFNKIMLLLLFVMLLELFKRECPECQCAGKAMHLIFMLTNVLQMNCSFLLSLRYFMILI